jgi:transposase
MSGTGAHPAGASLGVGHIRTKTHDYYRQSIITLFAELNYLDGKIISRAEPRHTHVELLRFLKQLDRDTSGGLDLHLIVDDYATHKHAEVKAWLARRPRFHIHFTPTGSSWLNLVERFFAEITQDAIHDGSFTSVRQLITALSRTIWPSQRTAETISVACQSRRERSSPRSKGRASLSSSELIMRICLTEHECRN